MIGSFTLGSLIWLFIPPCVYLINNNMEYAHSVNMRIYECRDSEWLIQYSTIIVKPLHSLYWFNLCLKLVIYYTEHNNTNANRHLLLYQIFQKSVETDFALKLILQTT